jgi:hypothetical protein
MVNLDLRKLSAPIEALRPELSAAYKRLDSKWNEIAECLKALKIPSTVSYTFSTDEYGLDSYRLVWRKWSGTRRICIEAHQCGFPPDPEADCEVTVTPYEEWSGEQRIDMLDHVPGLFEAAAKVTEEFIARIK